MAWMIAVDRNQIQQFVWPQRCAVCNADLVAGRMSATGDHVLFTTSTLSVNKVVSCQIPSCSNCLRRLKLLSGLVIAVPLVPWLLFLIFSQLSFFSNFMVNHLVSIMIALAVPSALAVILFWYKAIFLTRAVRLFMRGPEIAGIVFRNRAYAEQAAAANSLPLEKVFFLKGW